MEPREAATPHLDAASGHEMPSSGSTTDMEKTNLPDGASLDQTGDQEKEGKRQMTGFRVGQTLLCEITITDNQQLTVGCFRCQHSHSHFCLFIR